MQYQNQVIKYLCYFIVVHVLNLLWWLQFKASEDHTWEQTVGSSSSVKVHTGPLKERKAKKNRWDNWKMYL